MDDVDALLRRLRRTIRDERVLAAIASVPRDRFVPPELRAEAWLDGALPIGAGQTISQPTVVARMCELLALTGDEVVLDVGTGSGYHAAVLSRLAREVVSVERHAALSQRASEALADAGVTGVSLVVADGSRGYPQLAPYDAINVAAAARDGLPSALLEQLAPGGRIVAPVAHRGRLGTMRLVLARRTASGIAVSQHEQVAFVPLVEGEPIA
jgi:protein-L-isoaspartate(D-aspartate) O-methyltransferase